MMKQKFTNIYKLAQLLSTVLLAIVIGNFSSSALADVGQGDIDAIIRTREIALEALNTRNFTKIDPYLHPQFIITTVDNQVFHTTSEFEKYWNQQFSSTIKNIKMQLQGESIRTFLSPEIDVAAGGAITTFSFKDGKSANMALRWTAVLQKLEDKWMIQSLHFSSNLLDNPVLNAARQLNKTLGVAAGLVGFLLGAATMVILNRRTKRRATIV
ncbi:MAG: nuclear transport factor 2 family protein [Microcystis aeruginosa LG13-03]|nr:nuclear transport factor 2 family protein [Microcystis aeruginosa LG13-13]NCR03128.1 nuclear transport factor 2 family protein [Microcystis aeruginosa LG13-03]NCR61166.1 nuclear transport factor 2 family protein [Microcystis aeruginosa LG11-05]